MDTTFDKKITSFFFISKFQKKNCLYRYQIHIIKQLESVSDVTLIYLNESAFNKLSPQLGGYYVQNLKDFNCDFEVSENYILIKDTFFGFFCDIKVIISRFFASGKAMFGLHYSNEFNLNDFVLVNRKRLSFRAFKDFAENAFKFDPVEVAWLIDNDKDLSVSDDLYELIKNYNLPFIGFSSLIKDKTAVIQKNLGDEISKSLDFIKNENLYDVELIYEYLIANFNIGHVKSLLNLNFIININQNCLLKSNKRIAAFVYLYYDNLFAECVKYLSNFPEYVDIYIATNNDEKLYNVKALTSTFKNRITLLKFNARGRDIAAFLTFYHKYHANYDYACFLHDKESAHMGYTVGKNFRKLLWENTVLSRDYINKIVNILDTHGTIGLLVPPNVYHGGYFNSYRDYWANNLEKVKTLLSKIKINVPLDKNIAPITVGSVFWFKVAALKPLNNLNMTNDDFPQEPIPKDGTISHAIERIFPFIAQAEGFLTATVYNSDYAAVELENFRNLFKSFLLHFYNAE